MIFLDASVLLASIDTTDGHQAAALELVQTQTVATLDLAVYEVTNVSELRWRRPEDGARLRKAIWDVAALGGVLRVDQALADTAAAIAREHQITAYDAAYAAAAERMSAPLVSCDLRDLVSKGLAVTPSEMLERLRDEAGASADGDEADAPADG